MVPLRTYFLPPTFFIGQHSSLPEVVPAVIKNKISNYKQKIKKSFTLTQNIGKYCDWKQYQRSHPGRG